MNIYNILSSKPHNRHYLNRYIQFIKLCTEKNNNLTEQIFERHHICPKAKDLFPEYTNFPSHAWNKANLTPRQHFIAHRILSQVYPESNIHIGYIRMMTSRKSGIEFTSRQYEIAKIRHRKITATVLKKYRDEFGHPKGMSGKSFTKTQEEINKTSGKNNGMYGEERPDLASSNKDPELNKKRQLSLRRTLLLKSCQSIGFISIELARDYFTFIAAKIETDNPYKFMKVLNSQFTTDFPNITVPRGRIIFLVESFGINRPKRKSRLFNL